jgi:Flp pilus assembly protein TadG
LRRRNEDGVVLIEFAFVFALFVFILYALIAFGMALSLKHSITHAAAEGARAAVGVADDPGTPTTDEREERAKAEVTDSLEWLGDKYDANDVTAEVAECDKNAAVPVPGGPECMFVEITYPYEDRPMVPQAPGLGLMTPETMSSTAVVKISN